MPGLITRQWKLNGTVMDEQSVISEHQAIRELTVSTNVELLGRLDVVISFDPPAVQLAPWQARAILEVDGDDKGDG